MTVKEISSFLGGLFLLHFCLSPTSDRASPEYFLRSYSFCHWKRELDDWDALLQESPRRGREIHFQTKGNWLKNSIRENVLCSRFESRQRRVITPKRLCVRTKVLFIAGTHRI